MYNNRRPKNNKIVKNVKDYIIPIIIGLFALLIIFNIFRGGDDKTPTKTNKETSINKDNGTLIKFKNAKTKAFYKNDKNKKNEISDKSFVELGNKITVESGIIDISQNKIFEGSLNGRGEIEINPQNKLKLFYSDLFLKPKAKTTVEMKFATVNLNEESIVSLTQNDTASSIYVLSGFASIETKAKKTILVTKGKKISILTTQTHDKNLDLKSEMVDIEKSYLDDTWCSLINCKNILDKKDTKDNKTTKKEEKKNIKLQKGQLIKIAIEDGMESVEKNIKIKGNIINPNISDITINNKPVNIDMDLKTFSLDYELTDKINDIVYKIFDNSGDVIGRGVITVYFTGNGTGKTSNNSNKPQTINFPENNDYKIELPGESPYTTLKEHETIKGLVPAGKVAKIQVNNFTLTKFKPGATFWWYHANMIHGNMKQGTNEYRIKYFGHNGEKLYEHVYFIIKK